MIHKLWTITLSFELEYIKAWNNCLSGAQDAGKHANYDVFSVPQNEETAEVLFDDIDYLATWKAMEELVKKGKVKSIGKFWILNPKILETHRWSTDRPDYRSYI